MDYNVASNVSFKKKSLTVPIAYLSDSTKIEMVAEYSDGKWYTFKDVGYELNKVRRPDEDDLIMDKSNKDFMKQIDLITAEISLNIKKYKIDFDKVKRIDIILKDYGETNGFTFINKEDQFVLEN